MEDMKPCPFCGSCDVWADWWSALSYRFVSCRNCHATGPKRSVYAGSEQYLVEWNAASDGAEMLRHWNSGENKWQYWTRRLKEWMEGH